MPKFEYDKTFPKIVKCQLCSERLAEGGIPACCDACPTGASLFGRVEDLRAEGHRRLAAAPGTSLTFPIHALDSGDTKVATVPAYVQHMYGETETGGTQNLLLADVPFEKLGLPKLGDESRARLSETIQHALYGGMVMPTLLLGGLIYSVYRNSREEGMDEDEDTPPDAAPAARPSAKHEEGRRS